MASGGPSPTRTQRDSSVTVTVSGPSQWASYPSAIFAFCSVSRSGTEWLVPLALDRLMDDPLAGAWYPGDVLNAVLGVGATYWDAHPNETSSLWAVRQALEQVRSDATNLIERDDWPSFGGPLA